MNYLRELIEIAEPLKTFENPGPADWRKLEKAIGRKLPTDFKSLLTHFGTGMFGEYFYLLNPTACDNLHLSSNGLLKHRADVIPTLGDFNISLYPEQDGMINIGTCGTRHMLYLKPKGSEWILVHCDYSYRRATILPMSVSEFIYRLYKKKFRRPMLKGIGDSIWHSKEIPFFTPIKSLPAKGPLIAYSTPRQKPKGLKPAEYLKLLAEWKDR